MKKIILVGYMGSGKTTIGRTLSKKLNIDFMDLDEYIEQKQGMNISEIFKTKREIFFRKLESASFKEILSVNKTQIISLGGGTPCYANNHLHLQDEKILSFYLKASINTLISRISLDTNRPLIHGVEDLKSYIGQHLFERSFFYNYSKFKIEVDNKSSDSICTEISTIIQENI